MQPPVGELDALPPGEPSLHDIDPATWRNAATGLLDGDIKWLPVRHHSPACAAHARTLVETSQPYAVLVEGPRSFNDLMPLLVHPDAVYPLAIFAHVTLAGDGVDPLRHASYFPLCDYSPELAALRAGDALGARLRFIDADHTELCALGGPTISGSLSHERHLGFSRALDAAAARAGCRDHNDLWDQLFETTTRSLDDFVASVNAYGLLARSTTHHDQLRADGTLRREATMAAELRQVVADREAAGSTAPIVVVTGAFHTMALRDRITADADGSTGAGADADVGDPLTAAVVDSGRHLIRYSFDRLDALNGYAAGMPSPAWYQRLYELDDSGSTESKQAMLLAVLSEIAARLRSDGATSSASTPSLIAALHQAHGLGALRGRSSPGRTDLIDAVTSCFVQGDVGTEGLPVEAATRAVLTGDRIGAVPPGTDRPPIAADFDAQCRTLRLPLDTSTPVRVDLDIYRSAAHRNKSRFLHGLTYLDITYANWAAGPRHSLGLGSDLIRESWVCQLSPATDMGLVEASAFGPTILEAVAERYVAATSELEAAGANAASVAVHLSRAAELGVHGAVPRVAAYLRRQAVEDPSFSSVVAALTEIQLLWTARAPLEGQRLGPLPELIGALYNRACYLIADLEGLPEADLDQAIDGLLRLRDALSSTDAVELDPSLLWDAIGRLHQQHSVPPLAGVALGMLWSARLLADSDVTNAVQGRLLGGADQRQAAAFLRGLLLAAREVLWQIDGVTEAISELMSAWDDREFLNRLPGLRSAFAALTPRETDQVAELIGPGHFVVPVVTDLEPEALQAHLELDADIAERLAADGVSWATS